MSSASIDPSTDAVGCVVDGDCATNALEMEELVWAHDLLNLTWGVPKKRQPIVALDIWQESLSTVSRACE